MALLTEEQLTLHTTIAWLTIALALFVGYVLHFVETAPYGRYQNSSGLLSFLVLWKIPGRWAWVLQELVALVVCSYYFLFEGDASVTGNVGNKIAFGMFAFHYTLRSFVFPFRLRDPKPFSLFLFIFAIIFCSSNGYLQGRSLANISRMDNDWLSSPQFIAGCVLWAIGFALNQHSDNILINLRKPGEKGYKIPHGGLFEYVSGANYFSECLEWLGFAIACNTLAAYSFFIWTFCIIGPRAFSNHRWYLEKFKDDYPKSRKAFIPFIY